MSAGVVLFDIGSTLVTGPDSGPASRLARAIGLTGSQRANLQSALMTRRMESRADIVEYLRNELAVQSPEAVSAVDDLWRAQLDEAGPVDDAVATIEALAEEGLRIAVISNIWHPFLLSAKKRLKPVFDEFLSPESRTYSYHEGVAKPSLKLFQIALDRLRVTAKDVVMVGDSYREDIEPAMKLGMKTIWVLQRPAKELPNIVSVLNRSLPHSSATLSSVAMLKPEIILRLLAENGHESLCLDMQAGR